ncbi:MAG: 16S rRNA (uracil(1498)-N(3))-methyltransferase [bacterium]|nr:16S rRNA (uracil(1498)-N(3))-methyltransferase [bacterium]
MRCFYTKEISNDIIKLTKEEEKHLFSVLKAKDNSEIFITDGKGKIATATINSNKTLTVLSTKKYSNPSPKIHLYVASPRKQKMDQLLTQCTELGAWNIQPIVTERSVSIPNKTNAIDKWKIKLIEACKQAHNPFIPKIQLPISFNQAINSLKEKNFTNFFGATTSSNISIHSYSKINTPDIAWLVGPEGGFTDNEIEIMLNNSFNPLKIGKWIMRVETAAVAGITILQEWSNNNC